MTRITVVTPCHNAEPFIAETIESVLAQSYPRVEHVIVDDASRDGSWEIVREYTKRYPDRVRAIRLDENRGGCHARNRGVEGARGELLMFLDADDVIAPGTLAALVQAVEDRPLAVAFCPWMRLRRNASGAWETGPADAPLPESDPDVALRGWVEGTAWAPPCAVLWRRDAYELTGGWDETLTLNDDGDLMMRALALGARPVCAAGGEALYRWHDAAHVSVSQTFLQEHKLRSQVRVLDKLAEILEAQHRLAPFAPSLGLGYQRAALLGFQSGHREMARACLRRGEELGSRRPVSPTPAGRLVVRILGLERKEMLVQTLARMGLMSPQRRRLLQMQRTLAETAGGRS
ncbi:MAG TPA: glycosyltransferase family A protein [Longimicrobium sp.]|jgi:glycosyltransferase involved in cell wall biosynthesis